MAGRSSDARSSSRSGWRPQHRPAVRRPRQPVTYTELSTRPLHILAFLLPLIICFEVGSNLYLADPAHGTVETIRAQSMLLGFFQSVGVAGRFLPAITIITVLVVWHLMLKDSWRLRPTVLARMAVESLTWTVPLMVTLALVKALGGTPPPGLQGSGGLELLTQGGRATISLGAGLYEELLFRMVGVTLLHGLCVDVIRIPEKWGTTIAILVSAAVFTVYHDVTFPAGGIDVVKACSLMVAGAYFGLIYVMRGFGIVVAVHTLYDLIVLLLLPHAR